MQESDAEKIARLEHRITQLEAENERLRRAWEEALRAANRQAAPFSCRHPKAHPAKPGRKPGTAYGRRCRRAVPARIDERIDVLLPARCPHCGGGVEEAGVVRQYQTEIPPPRVEHIEFRIHVGRCRHCRRLVQGRHPRQTSDAVGGAASQLGPRALALAAVLNKQLGLPYGKTAAVLEQGWGLRVSRGGLCQALARLGRKAEPTYARLVERIRASPSVTPDETGWKVSGRLWWMWAFSSEAVTVYAIQPGRGLEQAAAVLGADFAGFLVRDGWSVYRQFAQAAHQTCLAHLLRRCRGMIEVSRGRGALFPRAVASLLASALALRQRSLSEAYPRIRAGGDAGTPGSRHGSAAHAAAPRNQRLARHLQQERDALFTFLYCPGLEATNWRAEQAIRPMVVTRKVWGGNRTPTGAHAKRPAQRFANLPPTASLCHPPAGPPALLAAAAHPESQSGPFTLNKYKYYKSRESHDSVVQEQGKNVARQH
ncbi:MAG: IS66 family transposase [Terracidiphilus sp.]